MEESERQKYEAKSQELRADLKHFEGEWAKKHDGKKPGRDDIKQNPIIAQKYKKYNQVRDILAGKIPPPKTDNAAKSRKRKSDIAPSQTPTKRTRPFATPSKPKQSIDIIDTFETPSIRRLFSPVVPTSIGPTPQRDGRVLGMFDLLDESEDHTPSRARHGEPAPPSPMPNPRLQATPSKRKHADMELGDAVKLDTTPVSVSKRTSHGIFATPLKKRDGNVQDARTPSTGGRLQFSTPAFLKRAPLPPMDEKGQYVSPPPVRLPRKPLVRGLSSVVASLRKLEEEKLDDELDVLREMEMEMEGGLNSPPAKPKPKPNAQKENILAPDSQKPQLLGGFDDEGQFDSEPEEQLGRDGQPLRIFKKKGQKRTTRKVNMRPTRAKRPQESLEKVPSDIEDESNEVVPETQRGARLSLEDEEPLDLGSDSDFSGSDAGDEKERQKKKKKKVPESKTKTKEPKEDGPIKKAARKVNELAHANFKRLKLRNNGAKGGPGFGSRFRRRR
ncbi:DNA replication/checkpoint protein [Xylariales sp. PMI_506]|nr:DNA replication/checkpoint protein [Xylariales sp. PMI_506]